MNSSKNVLVTAGFVLSVSFLAAAAAVWLVSYHASRASFDLVRENSICRLKGIYRGKTGWPFRR